MDSKASERNPGFTASRHDYEMLEIIGQLTAFYIFFTILL